MHRREVVLEAVVTRLENYVGLTGVTVLHDDPIPIDELVSRAVEVVQGPEVVLQQLSNAYLDCELTFTIRLHAKVSEGVRPNTLLNDLHVQVIKALTPGADSTLGVTGASFLTENGTGEPSVEAGQVPSAELDTNWYIRYRRDIDDPENLTP